MSLLYFMIVRVSLWAESLSFLLKVAFIFTGQVKKQTLPGFQFREIEKANYAH